MTVIFCGPEAVSDDRLRHFQRVITHDEAAKKIVAYPITQRQERQSNPLIQEQKTGWKEKAWKATKLAAIAYFVVWLVQGIAHNWPSVGSGAWHG